MANCTILFDQNEHGTYFTGQIVTGKVVFDFNKPKKLKGIKLQICGYAACQWMEKHGKKKMITKVKGHKKNVYVGREDYIASTTYLVGSDDGHLVSMDAGSHVYTFACPIPINCPSSFEGTFGHIRYLAKVTSMKPGSSNKTHTVGFTVLKLLDLNQENKLLKAPCNNEALENFCFFHTKAVYLKVEVQQTGYVPGQFMLVNVQVKNESSVNCQKVLIFLSLRATYTSDTPYMRTASEKICLVKKVLGPCPKMSSKNYAESIRIPATPPTCEHLSKVVRVSYEITAMAVMNHFMRNPRATLPIMIGNVPLTNTGAIRYDDVPTTSSCAMQIAGDNAHNMFSEQIQVIEEIDETEGEDNEDFEFVNENEANERVFNELPPPTYEEAMHMTRNIAETDDVENTNDAANFTPRYPVFNVDAINSITPPPNPPQKRRRRKKKRAPNATSKEKLSVESPTQI